MRKKELNTTSEEEQLVAIRIEGGSDIRVEHNVSIGVPLLEAKNVDRLSAIGNRVLHYSDPSPDAPAETKWSARCWLFLITVVSGVVVWIFSFYLSGLVQ